MINAKVIQLTMLRANGRRDASDLSVYQLFVVAPSIEWDW